MLLRRHSSSESITVACCTIRPSCGSPGRHGDHISQLNRRRAPKIHFLIRAVSFLGNQSQIKGLPFCQCVSGKCMYNIQYIVTLGLFGLGCQDVWSGYIWFGCQAVLLDWCAVRDHHLGHVIAYQSLSSPSGAHTHAHTHKTHTHTCTRTHTITHIYTFHLLQEESEFGVYALCVCAHLCRVLLWSSREPWLEGQFDVSLGIMGYGCHLTMLPLRR